MKLVSLKVGLPKNIAWQGKEIFTGIYKTPVDGQLGVSKNGFEQDDVGDPRVHGGEHKAVYAYPHEHYAHFEGVLGRNDFVMGQFGENLTTHGLLESEMQIGDRFRIGTALLEVSQPREPCFKLGIRMNDPSFVKVFLKSLRTGFYLRVIEDGDVESGQEIELVERATNSLPIRDVVRLKYFDREDIETIRMASTLQALSPNWRTEFHERLLEMRD